MKPYSAILSNFFFTERPLFLHSVFGFFSEQLWRKQKDSGNLLPESSLGTLVLSRRVLLPAGRSSFVRDCGGTAQKEGKTA